MWLWLLEAIDEAEGKQGLRPKASSCPAVMCRHWDCCR